MRGDNCFGHADLGVSPDWHPAGPGFDTAAGSDVGRQTRPERVVSLLEGSGDARLSETPLSDTGQRRTRAPPHPQRASCAGRGWDPPVPDLPRLAPDVRPGGSEQSMDCHSARQTGVTRERLRVASELSSRHVRQHVGGFCFGQLPPRVLHVIGIGSAEIVADHESWPSLVAIPEKSRELDGGVRLHAASVRDQNSHLTPCDPRAGDER